MSKIDPDDHHFYLEEVLDGVDDNGMYDKYINDQEVNDFLNSLEGRLMSFTDQELIDEYYRRMFEPYKKALQELREKIDNLTPPF